VTSPAPSAVRSYAVWGAAVAAYAIAVLHRSSLGVAGLAAAHRFDVGASVLASLAVAQLVVYAVLQIPVGLVLDRVGPRALIVSGAMLMACGQLVLAVATAVPGAVAGRMLVGAGDAMTFVSVIRLVPAWFPFRRVPLMTQLTGGVGQLGQVLAAAPLVAVLHARGWVTAIGGLAVVGVLAAALVAVVVRDAPGSRAASAGQTWAVMVRPAAAGVERAGAGLRAVVREPGARVGFWIHFLSQFSTHTIVLLWGVPFLVEGQGRTVAEASALLTVNVVAAVVAGPVIGELTARRPQGRTRMVLCVAGAVALAWAAVLVPSRPSPVWVLATFMVVVAVGGPASLIGFDVARSSVPAGRLGTATGVVNTGGFIAAFSAMLAVGVVLDRVAPTGVRDLDAYRCALAVVAGPWLLGVVGVLVSRRRMRAAHPGIAV